MIIYFLKMYLFNNKQCIEIVMRKSWESTTILYRTAWLLWSWYFSTKSGIYLCMSIGKLSDTRVFYFIWFACLSAKYCTSGCLLLFSSALSWSGLDNMKLNIRASVHIDLQCNDSSKESSNLWNLQSVSSLLLLLLQLWTHLKEQQPWNSTWKVHKILSIYTIPI